MIETLAPHDSLAASRFFACHTVKIAVRSVVFIFCLMLLTMSKIAAADDAYIAGYAAAVLHNEFKAAKASLLVQNGVVTVDAESLGTVDRTKVQAALERI